VLQWCTEIVCCTAGCISMLRWCVVTVCYSIVLQQCDVVVCCLECCNSLLQQCIAAVCCSSMLQQLQQCVAVVCCSSYALSPEYIFLTAALQHYYAEHVPNSCCATSTATFLPHDCNTTATHHHTAHVPNTFPLTALQHTTATLLQHTITQDTF